MGLSRIQGVPFKRQHLHAVLGNKVSDSSSRSSPFKPATFPVLSNTVMENHPDLQATQGVKLKVKQVSEQSLFVAHGQHNS